MADLEDIPVVGKLVAVLAGATDLVLYSGDLIMGLLVGLVDVVLGSPELLLPIVSMLNRLASRFAWLPPDLVETVLTVVLVALVVKYIGDILSKASENA